MYLDAPNRHAREKIFVPGAHHARITAQQIYQTECHCDRSWESRLEPDVWQQALRAAIDNLMTLHDADSEKTCSAGWFVHTYVFIYGLKQRAHNVVNS